VVIFWSLPNRFIFKTLGLPRRLLVVYLLVMAIIFGISSAAFYLFLARNLKHELDKELLLLARATAPSLEIIKAQKLKSLKKNASWQHLFSERKQGLEWFDADGKLLAKEGSSSRRFLFFKNTLPISLSEGVPLFEQKGRSRSVTIVVYFNTPDKKNLLLKGYIRASQSTQEIQTVLNQLHLGLWIGGIAVVVLISLINLSLARQALEPSRQSLQRLAQFTAEASHELRNPLTRISIASEVMLNRSEYFKRASDLKKLEEIDLAAKQMQRLVEDLMFLVRADTGALTAQIKRDRIFLSPLLRELIEHFEPIARAKGILMQVNLSQNLAVRGDKNQLNRLFSHLLDNAIKYTDPGGKINLSMHNSKGLAVIEIKDTGIGIAFEYQSFIFQAFWRSEQALARQSDSLGMGLAIASAIVRQHEGKITVNSQLGQGSCFQVDFLSV
jgi:two-component system, OmpR family, manganese sensing sensor histidine kinase